MDSSYNMILGVKREDNDDDNNILQKYGYLPEQVCLWYTFF